MTPGEPAPAILLDTCAVIWLVSAGPLSAQVRATIMEAAHAGGIYVSTATAWEVGMLSRPRPSRKQILEFWPDPKAWFARLITMPGINEAPITAAIAIDAWYLPGEFHADPMDRLIVATARHSGTPIVTGDRKILNYAEAGFVHAIPC